jgi:Leucine-rich repeat (LRR) protein
MTVPDSLRKLTQLQELSLGRCRLTEVPDWFYEFSQLKALHLGFNQLTTIHNSLRGLTQLRELSLNDNRLTAVPEWLVQMPQLEKLYIDNNPITQPPPEHLGKARTKLKPVDLESVRRYYAQLRWAGQALFYEAKLLLIGEGGAGKTSLARKLIDPTAPLPPPDESTEGIDILTWQFPVPPILGKARDQVSNPQSSISPPSTYQANIWDFGGQSVYHATHQFFLSKRSVYVLLADTRRQHTDFYDWLRMQETFGEDSPVLLLKNKNRQHGNQFVIENLPQLRERFPNLDKIIELDLNNIPDEVEWPELLRYLQKRLMALDHIGQPRPKTWVEIRQTIRNSKRDSISRRDFLHLCRAYRVTDEKDALQLSDYLHHVGDILHFEDDPILANLVILKPTWALDAVYRVLDNKEIVANWG